MQKKCKSGSSPQEQNVLINHFANFSRFLIDFVLRDFIRLVKWVIFSKNPMVLLLNVLLEGRKYERMECSADITQNYSFTL